MIYLLRYSDFTGPDLEGNSVGHTKHFQHIEMARIAQQFDRSGFNTGEIGCKTNFANLLKFESSRRFVIDPYNDAPGAGLSEIPKLPYPIALFRCLVGPDSGIIPDEFLDISFSISVIEHVGQQEAGFDCSPTDDPPSAQEVMRNLFCSELFRVTRPGGMTFHTVDHAARNLSFISNFERAGFRRLDMRPPPSVEECLNDSDAVRQRVGWGAKKRDQPMPLELQRLHACLMMAFYKPA